MYCIYFLTLFILFLILMMLWREERRFRNNITHGLVNKYWILREKRRFIRFNKEIKIRYNLLQDSPNFHNSKTINISKKGLCILTYEKLKEKGYLDLEIDIPGFSKPVRLVGEVIWTKNLHTQDEKGRRLFYVGVRFSKISPESEAMLLTHLNTLKGEPLILEA